MGCGNVLPVVEASEPAGSSQEAALESSQVQARGGAVTSEGREFILELGSAQDINVVELKEEGSRIRKYRIDVRQGQEWKKVYSNDLVEGYHLCVLKETVNTDAIRIVVETEEGTSNLTSIVPGLRSAVARTNEFTNTAYVSSTYFEHSWDNINDENFKSLSDIIMIGNFCFDKNGKFVIIEHGADGTGVTPYNWDDQYILSKFEQWKERVMRDPENRLWVSITCLKEGSTGAPGGNTNVFRNADTRKAFIDQLITFGKQYNVAGFDVDWEYPASSQQWQDYNNLINEASKALHENGMMLSSAQSTGTGLSLQSLNALDRINIMSYDNYGTMNNHSTFYNSAVNILKEFKNKGVDPQKLILGMPYYGVKTDSYFEQWDYSHIYNQMMTEQGAVDPGVNVYAKWGFNGTNLIRDKVLYAIEQEIGGVFIWQMKNDIFDFTSEHSLAGTTNDTIQRFIQK